MRRDACVLHETGHNRTSKLENGVIYIYQVLHPGQPKEMDTCRLLENYYSQLVDIGQ